jgi:hypothetical protein
MDYLQRPLFRRARLADCGGPSTPGGRLSGLGVAPQRKYCNRHAPPAGQPWSTRLPFNFSNKLVDRDILEAEWDALHQGNGSVTAYYAKFVELCTAVQADIASAFVVRKLLRKLPPVLHTHCVSTIKYTV